MPAARHRSFVKVYPYGPCRAWESSASAVWNAKGPSRTEGCVPPMLLLRHRPFNPSNPSAPSARQDFVEQLQCLMRSLADHAAAAADATGDFMAAQCVARRLPQRPPAAPVPLPPAKKLVVRWADPTAVRVVLESRPGQEAEIQIYHTMENDAANHMQPELEPCVEMAYSCCDILLAQFDGEYSNNHAGYRESERSAVFFGKTLPGNAPPARLRSHNQLALCWRAWTICQPYRLLRIVSLMFRIVVSVPLEISCLSLCQRRQNAYFCGGGTKPTVTLAVPALEALNRACGAWILASSLGSLDLVEGESGSESDVWDLVVMLNQFCEGFKGSLPEMDQM